MKVLHVPLLFLLNFSACLSGKGEEADTTSRFSHRAIGLPIVFYRPETSLGMGWGGIYYNKDKQLGENFFRENNAQMTFVYTLKKQAMFWLTYNAYLLKSRYLLFGELAYRKMPYVYYGIGDGESIEEDYTTRFPRLRFNGVRRFTDQWQLGVRYWWEQFNIEQVEPGGELENDAVTGSDGGTVSGLGMVSVYDSRNKLFTPTSGVYVEVAALYNEDLFSSDFHYQTYDVDVRKYMNLKGKHVIAAQLFGRFNYGDPPFTQMAQLGGRDQMRGYYEGQYRDKKMLTSQVEYRSPTFWRLGFVSWVGYGGVADRVEDFNLSDFKYSFGGGVRFLVDKKETLNFRVDWGFGQNTNGLYATVAEAF